MIGVSEMAMIVGLLVQSGADLPETQVACMARNIYHEARGEDLEGQFAVANVTMNRVASPDYPDDVCSVVGQDLGPGAHDCQFSWHCDGASDAPREIDAYQLSVLIAVEVMTNRAPDNTDGALFYLTKRAVYPSWVRRLEIVKQIGSHVFLRPKITQG